jgi:hypothetical protein
VAGLCLLIGILLIPTTLCQIVTGVGLALIEPLRAKLAELLEAPEAA